VTGVAVNSLASTLTQCNMITGGMLHVRFACTRASQAWRGSALNAMWMHATGRRSFSGAQPVCQKASQTIALTSVVEGR